jgi:hypothetical protein
MEVDQIERAWAADFFDGEGYVGKWYVNKKTHAKPTLTIRTTIHQAHPAVLERFKLAVGCGKLRGPYRHSKRPNWSPMWEFQAGTLDTLVIREKLLPYLSVVKQTQFNDVAEAYLANPRRKYCR